MADKALLCGINEYKSISPLRGCINDLENMKRLLIDVLSFDAGNIKTLTDEQVTKDRVQAQMDDLFRGVGAGERVLFHFSGHGSYTTDEDGEEDEAGGRDELICLYDMDFDDPQTYFLDDELGRWAKSAPRGVRLVIVLDNCHSGTGTRLAISLAGDRSGRVVEMEVAPEATAERSVTSRSGTRSLGVTEAVKVAASALNVENEDLVRVRFVPPPPHIQQKLRHSRRRGTRGFAAADINHVLLAGCRDDQTAADARIGGDFNGAFTYTLCKVLRADGGDLSRRELIERVERALRQEHFEQVPQLEASSSNEPLFGSGDGQPATTGVASSASHAESSAGGADEMRRIVDQLRERLGEGQLASDVQQLALELLKLALGQDQKGGSGRRADGRHLVYVHGICSHSEGYSDGWWEALRRHTGVFGDGRRDGTRHEVLWSDLVNERALREALGRDLASREAVEQRELSARIRGALEERATAAAIESGPIIMTPEVAADLPPETAGRDVLLEERTIGRGVGIPGFGCVDDFTRYLLNDGIRAKVIGRFTDKVRRLLDGSAELDVIAHSWGAVVAYEALRELDGLSGERRVRNFFTVGAALAIGPVKGRLRRANRDGRKPRLVRRWINIDAKNDPVGGRIQGRPFQVDAEFLDLPNLGCGRIDFSCAHSSYFKSDNAAVNRDIFAAFMQQA